MTCVQGHIRSGYTRQDGVIVRPTFVCTKTKTLIGPLKKGTLSQFGYSIDQIMTVRRQAVKKAVKKYGALAIFRKLNAVATLQKNSSPENSKKFKADAAWLKKEYQL